MSATVSTNMLVAVGTLLAKHDGGEAGSAHVAARALARASLARCGLGGAVLLAMSSTPPLRALLRAWERRMLPGLTAHYAWRKRRIAAWAEAAIRAGATQLLVIGAGYDALAARLCHAYPQITAFEIDRSAVLAIKARALAACHLATPRLHAVPGRTINDIPAALRACGWRPRARTLVIAEGVLMYLRRSDVADLFGWIADDVPNATVVATLMEQRPGQPPGFRHQRTAVDRWLRRRREAFLWGVDPADIATPMAGVGLRLVEVARDDEPGDADPCPGEWLVRATAQAPARASAQREESCVRRHTARPST